MRASRAMFFFSTALLFSDAAQAMEIRQFDKMADRDQVDYLDGLITGAEKVLMDTGKPALAAQVERLFTTKLNRGDNATIGMIEFERNLALLRLDDAKAHEQKPNDPRLEVEDVIILTLHKNNIELPDAFYTINANFRPKLPPKK
jgi:hypothetical protein